MTLLNFFARQNRLIALMRPKLQRYTLATATFSRMLYTLVTTTFSEMFISCLQNLGLNWRSSKSWCKYALAYVYQLLGEWLFFMCRLPPNKNIWGSGQSEHFSLIAGYKKLGLHIYLYSVFHLEKVQREKEKHFRMQLFITRSF